MAPPGEVRADETGPVRRDGKSVAAYRTTGEVAAALDLPPHVLRFWESKFPQLKPLKRSGGRRYYRPEDIDLLRRIRQCLYQQGYAIRGVQKLLRDGTLHGDVPLPASISDTTISDTGETPPPELAAASVITAQEPASASRPSCQLLRETLAELRRELIEIRALLYRLTAP